jgi:hypothetical protein
MIDLPPLIIEQADSEEFRDIINTIGAKDQPLLIRWYQRLVAKQQAAMKLAQEKSEAK